VALVCSVSLVLKRSPLHVTQLAGAWRWGAIGFAFLAPLILVYCVHCIEKICSRFNSNIGFLDIHFQIISDFVT
jgi:hypothetical protein